MFKAKLIKFGVDDLNIKFLARSIAINQLKNGSLKYLSMKGKLQQNNSSQFFKSLKFK